VSRETLTREVAHALRAAGSGVLEAWPVRALIAGRRLRAVEHALAEGLPAVLAEPLRFLASGEASEELRTVQSRVEAARRELPDRIASYSSTADPMSLGAVVSVSRAWGSFLYLCMQSRTAASVIELGVAGGISGSYLASAASCRSYVGLEGAAWRLEIARRTLSLSGVRAEIEFVEGRFEETLPGFVAGDRYFDLAYIDGDHYMEPTLSHMRRLTPRLNPGALVIFDDIRWSTEMFETWQRLSQWPGVSDAVDVGRMGVCVWQGGEVRPRLWDLARELAWPKPVQVTTSLRPGQAGS
jgi:predicted O-methyltransferase YrrM